MKKNKKIKEELLVTCQRCHDKRNPDDFTLGLCSDCYDEVNYAHEVKKNLKNPRNTMNNNKNLAKSLVDNCLKDNDDFYDAVEEIASLINKELAKHSETKQELVVFNNIRFILDELNTELGLKKN